MSVEKIITDWKKKSFKPIYWLEGEEEYFIEKVIAYAEHNILSKSEVSFNLSVFYGKDAGWADIVNACRRYPMFAERQVVILKEAQQMKDVEKLETYIENPLSSTIFVVSYKGKKLDARKKFTKLVKERGVLVTTKKMYDSQLPEWTKELLQSKGLSISQKGLALLVDHIGNDLIRIENEIEKILVNLDKRTNITEEDIEEYIGVSKDFNVFELQNALGSRNQLKAYQIAQYFADNPKDNPMVVTTSLIFSFFVKLLKYHGLKDKNPKTVAPALGISPFFLKDYDLALKNYSMKKVSAIVASLREIDLKSKGVGANALPNSDLLKEMLVNIFN